MLAFFILVIISICAEGFKLTPERSVQRDYYSATTYVVSWIDDGALWGYFRSWAVEFETPVFLLARNIRKPYTIINWDNKTIVLCPDRYGYAKLKFDDKEELLPIRLYERIKYDYTTSLLYTFSTQFLAVYDFASLKHQSIDITHANRTFAYATSENVVFCNVSNMHLCGDKELVKIMTTSGKQLPIIHKTLFMSVFLLFIYIS